MIGPPAEIFSSPSQVGAARSPMTAGPSPPAIALSGVNKRFDGLDALKDVDLEIGKGELVALSGPSGSGKTVLLKTVVGLIEPDSGSVRIDGHETAGVPHGAREAAIRRIGMLFQRSALFDSMPVWENVVFRSVSEGSLDRKSAFEVAVEKIAAVGLAPETAELYPADLSGGMQKRAALARAIAHDPEVLLLDEPTAGLDPIMSNVIADLIRETAARLGATVLLVTSNMAGARRTTDRFAMMYAGRIVWQGPTGSIEDSGDPFVDQFVHRRAEGPIRITVD